MATITMQQKKEMSKKARKDLAPYILSYLNNFDIYEYFQDHVRGLWENKEDYANRAFVYSFIHFEYLRRNPEYWESWKKFSLQQHIRMSLNTGSLNIYQDDIEKWKMSDEFCRRWMISSPVDPTQPLVKCDIDVFTDLFLLRGTKVDVINVQGLKVKSYFWKERVNMFSGERIPISGGMPFNVVYDTQPTPHDSSSPIYFFSQEGKYLLRNTIHHNSRKNHGARPLFLVFEDGNRIDLAAIHGNSCTIKTRHIDKVIRTSNYCKKMCHTISRCVQEIPSSYLRNVRRTTDIHKARLRNCGYEDILNITENENGLDLGIEEDWKIFAVRNGSSQIDVVSQLLPLLELNKNNRKTMSVEHEIFCLWSWDLRLQGMSCSQIADYMNSRLHKRASAKIVTEKDVSSFFNKALKKLEGDPIVMK